MMDVQKLKEAQETIRQAEKELCLMVKKYLEKNNTITLECDSLKTIESHYNRGVNGVPFDIVLPTGLKVKLRVEQDSNIGTCSYSITCEELGIDVDPPTDSNFAAQGEINIRYTITVPHQLAKY